MVHESTVDVTAGEVVGIDVGRDELDVERGATLIVSYVVTTADAEYRAVIAVA